MDVAVDLARTAEDDGRVRAAAVIEHIEAGRDVVHRPVGMLDQFEDLRVGRQMDDDVELRPCKQSVEVTLAKVGDVRGNVVGPGVASLVDPDDRIAALEQCERQVGADLSAGSGNENVHESSWLGNSECRIANNE